jgi:hypothetical protein
MFGKDKDNPPAAVTSSPGPATPDGPPARPLGQRVARGARRLVLTVLLVAGAGFALWTWAALSYTYSSGERAGYLQKLSNRGWICKTWEGELALVNLPGAMPEVFHFSVRSDAAVKQLQAALGKRVVLHYDQHVGVPTSCFGETSYFITSVSVIDEAPPSQ